MMPLAHARTTSPLGEIEIACSDSALIAMEFADADDRFQRSLERRFGAVALVEARDPLGVKSRLDAYFQGDLLGLDAIAVDGGGSPFQRRVWTALREIPAGTTTSYGALAKRLAQPTATRAVGLANGANPISIVVPCHRVIGADGTLTGYGGGLPRKRWLLDHERRHCVDSGRLL